MYLISESREINVIKASRYASRPATGGLPASNQKYSEILLFMIDESSLLSMDTSLVAIFAKVCVLVTYASPEVVKGYRISI